MEFGVYAMRDCDVLPVGTWQYEPSESVVRIMHDPALCKPHTNQSTQSMVVTKELICYIHTYMHNTL